MRNMLRCIVPTGHLGYAPIERGSFEIGLAESPDAIIADSGSCDIGPYPLGAGKNASPEEWQRYDLELILVGARELGVPAIIASANDTGTNAGVDKYRRILREIARERGLAPFTLGTIRHTIDHAYLRRRIEAGERLDGLSGLPPLTLEDVERTDSFVPVMGAEPILACIEGGADVIVTSRTSDCCPFAALALSRGFPRDLAYYWGKVLECASFCAEPYMGKETILGTIDHERVTVRAMHPGQRCTPASVAAHAMYERQDPYGEEVAGGQIDMRQAEYRQLDEKTTEVRGVKFNPASEYKVKLEGAGKVGERAYAIVGVRDPQTIANIDKAIAWARSKIEERYGDDGGRYSIYYHVYGKNGVLGEMEPIKEIRSHELGIVVEVVSQSVELCETIATLGARGLFYARLPTKGTAGGAALLTEDTLAGKPAYRWTMNHLLRLDDPLEPFPITFEQLGG